MRLLLLLSFLAGFWPSISSNTSSTPSNMTATDAMQSPQSQGSDLSYNGTTMVNNTVDGKENNSMESTTPPNTSSGITSPPSSSATQENNQQGTTKELSTALKENKTDSIVLPSHNSAAPQNDRSSATVEPTNPSTAPSPESNIESVNSTSVNSNQDASTFSSRPTSVPRSSTSPEIQSSSTERISPNITTEPTERKSDVAVTATMGSVQMTTVNETWVKNTTNSTEKTTTSGTFMDSTGSVEKSASNVTQRNTTDVTNITETTKITTEVPPKEKTQEREENNTMLSEAYCGAESSKQHFHLMIKKVTDCETFVKEKGKSLAKQICSQVAQEKDLNRFYKCEVQFSPEKEHQSNLIIDISFKVKIDQMNEVMKMLKMEELEMKEEHEGSKEQQTATELKKLIAMVVTGSLLLLVFLSAIVYRCSQRKSKHKDPYLTEELHTVDNGCHDNPAMDITERDSEMEEKNNSKATFLENTDGWIVPMDTHIKDELEEEDTHL